MVKLSDLDLNGLKVAYYDTAKQLEQLQINAKLIDDEITKREKEVEVKK